MKGPEMKRLKSLEKEASAPDRLVDRRTLQIKALKDIAEGNF